MRIVIIISLFCILFVGCRQKEAINYDLYLAQADSLMESQPDSALAILQTIPNPEKLHGKEQADYCFLLTQAEYKNYLPFTSDSLLNVAIAYYDSVGDRLALGKAYYYDGRFYDDQKKYLKAMEHYKRAEILLKHTGDNIMLALLYNSMGHLDRESDLKENALSLFKKALYYSERSGQVYHISMNRQEVAIMYQELNKPDSAGIYFAQILPYLSKCNEDRMATVFHNMGTYNRDYGSLDLAEKYILKSLELEKDTTNRIGSYSVLSQIYRKQGRIEASDSLWNVVLNGMVDLDRKSGVYLRLFEQNVEEQNYERSVFYANKRMECMDSIHYNSIAKDLAEIQAKYDSEVLLRKNSEQKTENIILWITVLGIMIASSGGIYIIVYSHKKYKINKEREISCLISEYQENLDQLEAKRNRSNEVSEKLILQIKEKEEQIESLRQKKESYKIADTQSIIMEGLEIDVLLKNSIFKDKLLRIDVSQYKSFIAYYQKIKSDFIQALKACGLTDYEIVISILFSLSLSHKQVCEVLCKSSETLSRVKLRLKDKIKENGNKAVLEKISSVVDLKL